MILVDQLQSCTLISLIPDRVSTEMHFLKPELLSGCDPGLWVTEGGGWFGTGLSGGLWMGLGSGAVEGLQLSFVAVRWASSNMAWTLQSWEMSSTGIS